MLCDAAERLQGGHDVRTGPLLASYAQLRPTGHVIAERVTPDLEFIAAVRAMGEELLGARVLELQWSVPRAPPGLLPGHDDVVTLLVPPGLEGPGDALALALGVALESEKLRQLTDGNAAGPLLPQVALALECAPGEVVERMGCAGEGEVAEALLQRLLAAGAERSVRSAPLRGPSPAAGLTAALRGPDDGPLFVLAGATERLHDLVSPWVRRLQTPLAKLAGSRQSDDGYALLPSLVAEDPRLHRERIAAEHEEGAILESNGALLIRFAQLDTALVDERARPVVTQLKRSRTRAVLCGRSTECLQEVLSAVGPEVRVVVLLGEALGALGPYPDLVIDGRTSHPLELNNILYPPHVDATKAASVLLSPPSLGLSPSLVLAEQVGSAPLLGPLALSVAHARAAGLLPRGARVAAAVHPPGDSAAASATALLCLTRMAGADGSTSPRARARR